MHIPVMWEFGHPKSKSGQTPNPNPTKKLKFRNLDSHVTATCHIADKFDIAQCSSNIVMSYQIQKLF